MDPNVSTTPFGRRPLSLAMVATQAAVKDCAPGLAVHKWQIFRAICEGRHAIGASERSLAVLNALLTFHPETVLTADSDPIVYPSNQQLALRAHGMAPATLRRHLAVLVECGLLIRRDSPNGKRYVRKGADGDIERAFGFDLKPLVARAAEFERYAEAVRTERRALAMMRERITLCRRDISKMIATGLEEGVAADWAHVLVVYQALVRRLPRTATCGDLEPVAEEFGLLAAEVLMLLETHINSRIRSGNESQAEHHIQNSKPDPSLDSEPCLSKRQDGKTEPLSPKSIPPVRSFPLPMVLGACPDIMDYAKDGITSWRDLVATAGLVRSILGISASAWEQAQTIFGKDDAAVVIAAILQRSDTIKSPGGYIRDLTQKAERGQFSLGPMLMALARSRPPAARRA